MTKIKLQLTIATKINLQLTKKREERLLYVPAPVGSRGRARGHLGTAGPEVRLSWGARR